jgi:hypothetical protein
VMRKGRIRPSSETSVPGASYSQWEWDLLLHRGGQETGSWGGGRTHPAPSVGGTLARSLSLGHSLRAAWDWPCPKWRVMAKASSANNQSLWTAWDPPGQAPLTPGTPRKGPLLTWGWLQAPVALTSSGLGSRWGDSGQAWAPGHRRQPPAAPEVKPARVLAPSRSPTGRLRSTGLRADVYRLIYLQVCTDKFQASTDKFNSRKERRKEWDELLRRRMGKQPLAPGREGGARGEEVAELVCSCCVLSRRWWGSFMLALHPQPCLNYPVLYCGPVGPSREMLPGDDPHAFQGYPPHA